MSHRTKQVYRQAEYERRRREQEEANARESRSIGRAGTLARKSEADKANENLGMEPSRKRRGWEAGKRLIDEGRAAEVERFSSVLGTPEALVQCWGCGEIQLRKVGIGRPDEIRCRVCSGSVEVLTVYG